MEARWPATVDRCGWTEQPTNRAGDNLSDELRLLVAGLLARSSSVTLQTVRRDRLDITEPCQMRGTHESKGPRWEQRLAFNHHFPPSDPPILYPRLAG